MVGGLQDFSVSPSPLGTNWVFELIRTWLGLDLGGLGTRGLGTGLCNKRQIDCFQNTRSFLRIYLNIFHHNPVIFAFDVCKKSDVIVKFFSYRTDSC